MGITKTTGFHPETNQMAVLLKALGHPARLEIVRYLIRNPSCICGDFVLALPLAQSTVSKHLSELKNAGLIKGNITGNNICYCLDEKMFHKIQEFIQIVQNSCTPKPDCC
jgi:ArsR family transcriptional regulator, arsenate/arsenite/antimonite-responsive transcriptional repressor